MKIVLGTWVPTINQNPYAEICHAFVYRWLIARGSLLPDARASQVIGPFDGVTMGPILWPGGSGIGTPVRVGGINAAAAGDIIGFFDGTGGLVHSMVAETAVQWVGANNAGCFGTATNRTTIPNAYNRMNPPLGWMNVNNNSFQSMGGALTVHRLSLPVAFPPVPPRPGVPAPEGR